jgi:hypothetical protein
VSFAVTGPVAKAIGIDATLIVAALVPAAVSAALYFVARLRRDEERYADAIGVPPAPSASAAGSSTPAIS